MERTAIIESLTRSTLIESDAATEILKAGAEFSVTESLASARKESLALTYKIRLKQIQKEKSSHSIRLARSVKGFINNLEEYNPEFLKIVTFINNDFGKYHLWLVPESNRAVGCIYTLIPESK